MEPTHWASPSPRGTGPATRNQPSYANPPAAFVSAATAAGGRGKGRGGAATTTAMADKKRLRHREYVKRSYNKKITTLETLKQEFEALEKEYKQLLVQRSVAVKEDPTNVDDLRALAVPILHKYLEAKELKDALLRENEELYAYNARQMKVQSRVQQLLDSEAQLPSVDVPFHLRPLSDQRCATIIAAAKDDIMAFITGPDKWSSGARVFGWTDQRQVRGSELRFALEKDVYGVGASTLLSRSWTIFSSPKTYAGVFTPSLGVELHVLQRVNADTLLLYRTVEPAGMLVVVKTILLFARLQLEDGGFMLVFRSVDKDLVQFEEDGINCVIEEARTLAARKPLRKEVWSESCLWVIFRDQSPSSCLVHFGGSIGGATTTHIWLMEVLFAAVRWENMAIGPTIAIEASPC